MAKRSTTTRRHERIFAGALLCCAGLTVLSAPEARAEGSAELLNANGVYQRLEANTILRLEILNAGETITWTGTGTLSVISPVGTQTDLASGQSMTTSTVGLYRLTLSVIQETDWSVVVKDTSGNTRTGRLYSTGWHFDANSYAENNAMTSSFYARVPGGQAGTRAVVELKFDGLAGFDFYILANSGGVTGFPGQSANLDDVTPSDYIPEFPLFLNPPEDAEYTTITPTTQNFDFSGDPNTQCTAVSPGINTGTFSFDTNAVGEYEIVCDTNGDLTFDPSGTDVVLKGPTINGTNTVTWDGLDNQGNQVNSGTYSCKLSVTVGELHYIALDIETLYEGLRLYEVTQPAVGVYQRNPLDMFWNDAGVEGYKTMPDGSNAAESSGAAGVNAGPITARPFLPLTPRSWQARRTRAPGGALKTSALLIRWRSARSVMTPRSTPTPISL